MSQLDYNSRLKPMDRKGKCGDPEYFTSMSELRTQISTLSEYVSKAKYCVIFTGAGISTAYPASIPDFRGPKGVWTRELKGDRLKPEEKTPALFNSAKPTFSHHAITQLSKQGYVHHVISQNVDGLHLRSGLPLEKLSEIHGNIFMEICELCGKKYFRDYDVGGMGLNYTGNYCESADCYGRLRDFAVDWDTDLPAETFDRAIEETKKADLVICLGTSLRIRPAGNMPSNVLKTSKHRSKKGKLVIVNLQETHLDDKATLLIHHYSDDVLKLLCKKLKVEVEMPEVQASVTSSRTVKTRRDYVCIQEQPGAVADYFQEEEEKEKDEEIKPARKRSRINPVESFASSSSHKTNEVERREDMEVNYSPHYVIDDDPEPSEISLIEWFAHHREDKSDETSNTTVTQKVSSSSPSPSSSSKSSPIFDNAPSNTSLEYSPSMS